MGILRGIKRLLGGRRTTERADYDAASDNRHISGTYTIASDRNQNRILEEERPVMRSRINSETRNNIYMRRVSKLYANFAVGTGPVLQVSSKQNKKWADIVQRKFSRWTLQCDARGSRRNNKLSLARMLHMGTRRLFPDGEFMLVMEAAPGTPRNESSLRLRPVRVNRRCTPLEKSYDHNFVDGIEFAEDGEPLNYWFLKADPGDTMLSSPLGISSSEFDVVPAERVIHVMLPDEFEQDTGEPLAAPALSTIAGDRRFRHATLLAAEVASKFAVFFEVDKPELLVNEDGESIFRTSSRNGIEIAPGTASFIPPGYKVQQVDPKHPSTTYPEFKRENLAELGLIGDMPVNLVTGDSSKHNFASAQFDGWSVEVEINCYRQYALEENALDPIFLEWLREATLAGVVPPAPADFEWDWGWPINRYWRNPLHQAMADERDMASRKKSLYDVWEENGKDADEMEEKLKKQDALIAGLQYKPSFLAEKMQLNVNEGSTKSNAKPQEE